MSGKRQITIRLTTLILVVVLIIVTIVVAVKVLKKDNKGENINEIKGQNINSNENAEEIPITNIDESTDFELSFLKMENNKNNTIYSPLSIKYALNMLNEGAEGNTKEQIEKVIKDLEITKYDNINKRLSFANGLYIRDTYTDFIKDEYIETLEDKYNAEVKYDAFKNAKNINKWIEDKTMGQIENMLNDSQISDPDIKMALINALAIDMEWEESFDTSSTYGAEFNLIDNSKMEATMMHNKTTGDSASYYKDEKVTALAMNLEEYDDVQLEFLAIMPKDNLSKYIENVTMEEINDIIDGLKLASEEKAGINISIPKFRFNYELNLNRDLQALGIKDAFIRDVADFTRMADRENLHVGEALHKANIDFTEEGVKAAAVTVILMKDLTAMLDENKPIEINIDNPFMYLIRDKESGEIWFVGTVYEPNSWEDDKADYEYR